MDEETYQRYQDNEEAKEQLRDNRQYEINEQYRKALYYQQEQADNYIPLSERENY